MAIDYPAILDLAFAPERWTWTETDSLLYALSVGTADEQGDPLALPCLLETRGLRANPAFVSVIGASARMSARRLGIDRRLRVHGEQSVEFLSPLPPSGTAHCESRIVACFDKGADKGALIISETEVRDERTGVALARLRMTSFARGDGGFGGPPGPQADERENPVRAPDASFVVPTQPHQALLFRLLRDRNPLHADPVYANSVGFPRPILHGLCLFGVASRVILGRFLDWDAARLKSLGVRFSSPVFPGEDLRFDFWREGSALSFQAVAVARNRIVLCHGISRLA